MINEETFASRLTSLREQKKVSAREMSLDLGQNGSYINRIENRKAFPSMQCFFYICDYLQISPAAFFDDTTKAPHALDALTELLKTLSVEQLELIAQIAWEFSAKQNIHPKKKILKTKLFYCPQYLLSNVFYLLVFYLLVFYLLIFSHFNLLFELGNY